MSIFNRIPPEVLRREFTHTGLYFGICPVYLNLFSKPTPIIVSANWVPNWYLNVVQGIADVLASIMQHFDPLSEPLYMVHFVEKIK